jgi:hypothetical protein
MSATVRRGDLHEVSVAIGQLTANVDNLTSAIRDMQKSDAEFRYRLTERVEQLHDKIGPVVTDMAEVKPLVAEHERERTERRARSRLVRALIATAVALSGYGAAKTETWWSSWMRLH